MAYTAYFYKLIMHTLTGTGTSFDIEIQMLNSKNDNFIEKVKLYDQTISYEK